MVRAVGLRISARSPRPAWHGCSSCDRSGRDKSHADRQRAIRVEPANAAPKGGFGQSRTTPWGFPFAQHPLQLVSPQTGRPSQHGNYWPRWGRVLPTARASKQAEQALDCKGWAEQVLAAPSQGAREKVFQSCRFLPLGGNDRTVAAPKCRQ